MNNPTGQSVGRTTARRRSSVSFGRQIQILLICVSLPCLAPADECLPDGSPGETAAVRAHETLDLADCYIATGQAIQAVNLLTLAARQAVDPAELGRIAGRLGRAYAGLGDYEAATDQLLQGLELAGEAGSAGEAASLLNDLAGVYAATGESLAAIAAFSDSARLASPDSLLGVIAGLNLARVLWEAEAETASGIFDRVDGLRRAAETVGDAGQHASVLIGLGELAREIGASAETGVAGRARRLAYELLAGAVDDARDLDDRRLLSFAYGYLGRLYEDAGDHAQSSIYTRQAIDLAQAASANDGLYRWEWQLGRVQSATGRRTDAVRSYSSAIDTLARLGPTSVTSDRRFRQQIAPLYREYADLTLASTAGLSRAEAEPVLTAVQQALERFRVAEVQNYFENQCVLPETLSIQAPGDDVLVVYPILLDDRLELIVATSDDVSQLTVDVGLSEMTGEIRQLRSAIENAEPERSYLPLAQSLYESLISPLAPVLARVSPNTLVFVPDGPLRTLPFAVLHDGERFLVEQYSLSVTPGLSLIGASDAGAARDRVLANGIVDSVQGFAALPNVAAELASIDRVLPARTFANEAFRAENVENEILAGEYSIVHMATHAQFEADFRNSFLLAYDSLITMDELEDMMAIRRYSDQPIDLLVLSACETAAGDDRAALGLAGVAVKSGARSALASLWLIDDESTAELIGEFYRQLAGGEASKADALRGAQLKLLNDADYRHPTYWAPFLIIGDWR